MVSHVIKPIDPNQLIQSIRQFVGTTDPVSTSATEIKSLSTDRVLTASHHASTPAENTDGSLIDWAYLEQWVGTKPGRLVKLVKAALNEQLDKPNRLRAASAANDGSEVRRLAHELRSVAGNLRAQYLMAEATEVECIAQEDQGRGCAKAEHLAATTEQFLAELAKRLMAYDIARDETAL
jgi:HPt (histidine-containing phosphotransfer) domain-containing protein